MFTRLSASILIKKKTSEVITAKIIQHWIGADRGVMAGILFGKSSQCQAVVLTPAKSPWSNSLC